MAPVLVPTGIGKKYICETILTESCVTPTSATQVGLSRSLPDHFQSDDIHIILPHCLTNWYVLRYFVPYCGTGAYNRLSVRVLESGL